MTTPRDVLHRRGLLAGLAGLLGGCGFRPVYGPRATGPRAQQELASVDIALIPDRSGQLLRQALQARMDRGEGGRKRYTLTVSFGVASDSLAIQQDSTVTRTRQIGTATWTLKSLDSAQTTLTNGTARAIDGLNIIDQQYFAADLESEAVTRRVAEAVADQITLQLATYFNRRAASA